MSQLILLYDDACFLCQQFEKYIQLRKKHDVQILDARKEGSLVKDLAAR